MFRIDTETESRLRDLVERPAHQGEPTVLMYVHPHDAEAALDWWEATVGPGPRLRVRNATVPLPGVSVDTSGRPFRDYKSQAPDADLVLVDERHADKWAPVFAESDADVVVLQRQDEAA